jgi:hypothetical protein
MNMSDVMRYGHQTVEAAVDGLAENNWLTPGVCGVWSTREIIAHLASFEQILIEVLSALLHKSATPTLDRFLEEQERFNDNEVGRRGDQSTADIWREYTEANGQTLAMAAQIPVEDRRRNRILSWYGDEYDLEDFIAYTYYGHKQEHCAQIAVFRDGLAEEQK